MASGDEHIERPTGLINGINKDFITSSNFDTSTFFVYLNGLLIREIDDNGWIVTGVSSFQMKLAPKSNDTIHVRYIEI